MEVTAIASRSQDTAVTLAATVRAGSARCLLNQHQTVAYVTALAW
jgi:hypothetical protein